MRALILFALGLGGCAAGAGGAPDQVWTHAEAHADCAPWDGAATAIVLSNSTIGEAMQPPYLHISVYRSISESAGRAVLEGMQPGSLAATLCPEDGPCLSAEAGWVDLTPRGSVLDGRYSLHLIGGRTITGKFSAPIVALRVLCG